MNITAPEDLTGCDECELRDIERRSDMLRIRAIVELEKRGRNDVQAEYERKMAKRPQWAQTAAKLTPGPKARIATAVAFMVVITFQSWIVPLRSFVEKFEADQRAYSGQQGN